MQIMGANTELKKIPTTPNQRQSGYIILTLTLPMLLSCVPAKFSGYIPSGPGSVEGRYCSGPGIKDALRVRAPSGVQINIRAGQNQRNDTITLDVYLTVPDAVTAQLLESEFVLESSEWTQPRILPIDRIMGSGLKPGPNRYAPTDRLAGTGGSPGLFGLWFFNGDKGTLFETGLPKVSSFRLQFPPLSINGQTYRVDPINFEAYERLSVYTCVQ